MTWASLIAGIMSPTSGRAPTKPGSHVCRDCGGDGECDECDGRGRVDGDECPDCNGKGECVTCDGDGEVSS